MADFLTYGAFGKILQIFSSSAADAIKTDRTAEEEFQKISDEFQKQKKRFLVAIDDIDRLTPEQALAVFCLVKSVGRLPNVVYLLVFDRELAERILADRYPAERDFLQKIVQTSFEVPLPKQKVLHDQFWVHFCHLERILRERIVFALGT